MAKTPKTFNQLLEEFEEAVRLDTYKGGGHPADIPYIEQCYEDSKAAIIAHVENLEKHQLHEAEFKILKLRKALSDLVGASSKEDLEAIEMALRMTIAPDADKIAALNAIHALIETIPK